MNWPSLHHERIRANVSASNDCSLMEIAVAGMLLLFLLLFCVLCYGLFSRLCVGRYYPFSFTLDGIPHLENLTTSIVKLENPRGNLPSGSIRTMKAVGTRTFTTHRYGLHGSTSRHSCLAENGGCLELSNLWLSGHTWLHARAKFSFKLLLRGGARFSGVVPSVVCEVVSGGCMVSYACLGWFWCPPRG